MAKKMSRNSNEPMKPSGVKEHKEDPDVRKMTRFPPSLNGINKNLP
ncbi:hypothetical protein B0G52_103115 [Cohnella sp. SGD-V74]|nr:MULTISPECIES: hypothetical protein [unclassified Cohnella]PRX73518.1 hypothetical protein B0G52_103115 [Cohnella sp. SGD-V74]